MPMNNKISINLHFVYKNIIIFSNGLIHELANLLITNASFVIF